MRFSPAGSAIAELAVSNRLPSISAFREYAEAGGLMSYGQNLATTFRRAASYVDKILTRRKTGRSAGRAITKFELVVNRKRRGHSLTIPAGIIGARRPADRMKPSRESARPAVIE